ALPISQHELVRRPARLALRAVADLGGIELVLGDDREALAREQEAAVERAHCEHRRVGRRDELRVARGGPGRERVLREILLHRLAASGALREDERTSAEAL